MSASGTSAVAMLSVVAVANLRLEGQFLLHLLQSLLLHCPDGLVQAILSGFSLQDVSLVDQSLADRIRLGRLPHHLCTRLDLLFPFQFILMIYFPFVMQQILHFHGRSRLLGDFLGVFIQSWLLKSIDNEVYSLYEQSRAKYLEESLAGALVEGVVGMSHGGQFLALSLLDAGEVIEAIRDVSRPLHASGMRRQKRRGSLSLHF